MIFVVRPPRRIGGDVFPQGGQFPVVADDAFVVIALPDRNSGGVAQEIDVFGGGGFEPRNQ